VSTNRCTIGIRNDDGTVTFIYCHNDGGPETVGRRLAEHWTDVAKIRRLMSLCDLSVLGTEIGDAPGKSAPIKIGGDEYREHVAKGWCFAYHYAYLLGAGDRPFSKGPRTLECSKVSYREYIEDESCGEVEYKYIFVLGRWLCYAMVADPPLKMEIT